MGKYLVFIFWAMVAIFLAFVSITTESSSAILAEVEPQRYAVSFPKAVRVKEFYVVPGQQVKKGERLLKVERPDLMNDVENRTNRVEYLLSDLKKKEAQRDNQLYLNDIQFNFRKNELKNQIEQLVILIDERSSITAELENLNFLDGAQKDSTLERRLTLLKREQNTLDQERFIREQEIKSLFELEKASIEADVARLNKEIEQLKFEEEQLIQHARVDGAIGNIYVEIEELVPAYTNLLSVYENNPTVIRAFTNEHDDIQIESGSYVQVESTNRKYRIRGQIIEVGSRIIEYPQRLRTFDSKPSWGRELFIKIPEESRFLNGEKVFVIIEE